MNTYDINDFDSEDEVVAEIQRQQRWLNLPTMTEQELLETEIPEGEMFRMFRIMFNNNPSLVRVVRARDGSLNYNVDFVQNTYYVRERIERLMIILGKMTYRRLT